MELKIDQEFAIVSEAETGIFLLVEGLIAWSRLSGANDFRHLPLQLVSQGLERLLKLTLILAELEQDRLPTHREVREYGHRLPALTKRLESIMSDTGHAASRPATAEDLKFIQEDADLARLLQILSSFGEQGRYYNLDILLAAQMANSAIENPVGALAEFETEIVQRLPGWKKGSSMISTLSTS